MLDFKQFSVFKTLSYPQKFNDFSLIHLINDYTEFDWGCQFLSACYGKSTEYMTDQFSPTEEEINSKKFGCIIANDDGFFENLIAPRIVTNEDGNGLNLIFGDFSFPVEIDTDGDKYAFFRVGSLTGQLFEEVKTSQSGDKYSLFFIVFDEHIIKNNKKVPLDEQWLIRLAFADTKQIYKKADLLGLIYAKELHTILKKANEKSSVSYKQTVAFRCLEVGSHLLKNYRKVEVNGRINWVLDFGYNVDFWANGEVSQLLNKMEETNAKLAQKPRKGVEPTTYKDSWLVIASKEQKGDKCFVKSFLLGHGQVPKTLTPLLHGGIDPLYLSSGNQPLLSGSDVIEATATLVDDITF